MGFLANENIPLSTIGLPTEGGHDVFRVGEELPGASDRQVIEHAVNPKRILLTFNRDYGELIFRHKARNDPGVVYFRFTPVSPHEAGMILLDIPKEQEITLTGRFTVIERDDIRQRSLDDKEEL